MPGAPAFNRNAVPRVPQNNPGIVPGTPVTPTIAPPINVAGAASPPKGPEGVAFDGAPMWAYGMAGGNGAPAANTAGSFPSLGSWAAFNPWGGSSAAGNENRNLSYQGLDPRLDQLLTFGLGQAMGNYFNPAGQTYYGGPTVAGLTPEEQQAQQMLLGVAGNTSGIAGGATGFLDQLLQNGMNPGTNPQVEDAISATLRDVTRQATDPGGIFSQIRNNSLGNNAYGGTRQGVLESLGLGRVADSLGRTSADMRLAARGQDISNALGGVGQQGNVTSLATLPATLYGGVGAQNRGMNQAFMNDALTRWLYDTNQPNTRLQSLFNFINAAPLGGWGGGSQWLSDAALNSGGTSTAQNVAGGLAGAGSIISALYNAGLI